MSCIAVDDGAAGVCANCGKHGSETVKLKNCAACRLVKYCGVDCQKAHRTLHKKACKQRAEELKYEQLDSQGHERPEGDFCPICTLPIPFPSGKHSVLNVCCMKSVCNGCVLAACKMGMGDCAFCRAPFPDSDACMLSMVQARVEKKDPDAIKFLGEQYYQGLLGLPKDTQKAIDLYTEAAELGSIEALAKLGIAYGTGNGVQQDKKKAVHFYEKAAMQGHVQSRHNIGSYEGMAGNHDRAVRYFLISAKMGFEDSVEMIKRMLAGGFATKGQYAQAVKDYQNAMEEMESAQREEANRET